jgi:X-Pro dipeptidyl-peptidase
MLPVGAPAPAGDKKDDRPTPPPWLLIVNGVSRPQFDTRNAIEESIFVETAVDSDLDGQLDRVHLWLSRPLETASLGIKVPVIFEHSPYRLGTDGSPNHGVDVDVLPQEFIQPEGHGAQAAEPSTGRAFSDSAAAIHKASANLASFLDDFWVPRGYAVVLGESIGTANSDGCPTIGDMQETLGTKAIIDWLKGRARAWNAAGLPVTADWTTGDVGMIGTSYNGTLPNMVATTGVEGLRTIVPVSAISSWYDYYRANGLVRAPHSEALGRGTNEFQGEDLDVLAILTQGVSRFEKCAHITEQLLANQDRVTGDYSAYWHERDYLHRAQGIKASVFVVHGLDDYNVMTKAFASWWAELERYNVPRKIWLHKGGHGEPQDPFPSEYQRTLNRWFDYWLFGVENGIMDDPMADVQRPNGTYEKYANWPVPGTGVKILHLAATSPTAPGALTEQSQAPGQAPLQSFVDAGRVLDTEAALLPNPDNPNPNRLIYLSGELRSAVHMSGAPWVELRASIDNRYAANLTAILVDYGPAGSATPPVVVTRGWMDPQNRVADDQSRPLQQGHMYQFRWDLQPDDYIFPAGHRIGLVVLSTDHGYTLRPLPGTQLTIDPENSELLLPIVAGDCNSFSDEEVDADRDGYFGCADGADCNDANPAIYPGAPETCNQVDDDCDQVVDEVDADQDGYFGCAGGPDCNDANAAIHPGAPEICDGLDNNCDGNILENADSDGDGSTVCGGDCNDANPTIYPGAPETCNQADDDCDQVVDEVDQDADGYSGCGTDCDDSNAAVHPTAAEVCNGIDDNCATGIDEGFPDVDGDGYASCIDCSDSNGSIHPGAPEVCNNLDDDCNSFIDDGLDLDGDGHGPCDCNDEVPGVWSAPFEVENLRLQAGASTQLDWNDMSPSVGPLTFYDVYTGSLSTSPGISFSSFTCLSLNQMETSFTDYQASPSTGSGYWYLLRALNPCGNGTFGAGSDGQERIVPDCP